MTVLVMLGILIFGIVRYRLLPVNALPNVDFPTIQVSASLPGASPDTMASAVATPLEKQFSTIAGIDSMTSQSTSAAARRSRSSSRSTATSTPPRRTCSRRSPRPRGRCRRRCRRRRRSARSTRPNSSILLLALTSETQPLSVVDDYAENNLAQRISTISGVAQVQVYGSQQVRGAHPARSERARDARHRAHRRRAGDRQRERQPADRHALRQPSARRR